MSSISFFETTASKGFGLSIHDSQSASIYWLCHIFQSRWAEFQKTTFRTLNYRSFIHIAQTLLAVGNPHCELKPQRHAIPLYKTDRNNKNTQATHEAVFRCRVSIVGFWALLNPPTPHIPRVLSSASLARCGILFSLFSFRISALSFDRRAMPSI